MLQKFCHWMIFKKLGWKQIGNLPSVDKYLFVGLPHTSNWDFVYGYMVIKALKLEVTIFAKDVFFTWPLGYFCRAIGLSPVNRRESTNFVDAVAEQFKKRNKLIALIAPEGTRKFVPKLKSGYFYIAQKANVPIVLAGPDFKNRTFTFKAPRPAMASFEEDAEQVKDFCRSMTAYIPSNTYQ